MTSALDPSLGIPVVCLVDDENVVRKALDERALLPVLPVIFLTGHGDVLTAVVAVKRGAYDFVEKPFSDHAPAELAISVRTVEVHRALIFEKMDVSSVVELANPLRLAGGRDVG